MQLENKYLRWHYSVAAVVMSLLIVGFMFLKGQNRVVEPGETLTILQSLSYLITFVGIPLAYGWFQNFFKRKSEEEKEEKENAGWMRRFYIFSVLALVNSILYLLTFDQSLMFVLIITLSVYLLNKPKISE